MQPSPLTPFLFHAVEAAQLGGRILMDYYGKIENIQNKNFKGDLVTEADIAAEKAIISHLNQLYPEHAFIGEESGVSSTDSEWQWIIDPLDGTTNFAHTHPMFCVSIGMVFNNEPVLGVVFNPYFNELFQAAKNQGASLNGYPLKVSKTKQLDHSLLATGFPYNRRETDDNNYREFCALTHATQGVRRGGSAALDLAYVASGRIDGYWEQGIKPWDIAAGIVLVNEAGGKISRYDGSTFESVQENRILATNGHLHAELCQALEQAAKENYCCGKY